MFATLPSQGLMTISVRVEGSIRSILRTSGVIALLTGPHQTSFSEPGSLTIRLSRGERPVFAPEYAVNAPVDVIADPVS